MRELHVTRSGPCRLGRDAYLGHDFVRLQAGQKQVDEKLTGINDPFAATPRATIWAPLARIAAG